jgi:hypothetical protein
MLLFAISTLLFQIQQPRLLFPTPEMIQPSYYGDQPKGSKEDWSGASEAANSFSENPLCKSSSSSDGNVSRKWFEFTKKASYQFTAASYCTIISTQGSRFTSRIRATYCCYQLEVVKSLYNASSSETITRAKVDGKYFHRY